MATTNVITEVQNIIDSNMTISEKKRALAAVKTERRPGCNTANILIREWWQKICHIKNDLKSKLHSQDHDNKRIIRAFYLSRCRNSEISKILNYAYDHGFKEWCEQIVDAESEFVVEWCENNLSLSKYAKEAINEGWLYSRECHSLKDAYKTAIEYGGWCFEENSEISFRKLHKELGKFYGQFLTKYKTEILPACKKLDEEIQIRKNENADWLKNFGINKYKEVMSGMLNYVESPLSADKNTNVVMFPYAFIPCEDVDEDWEYYSKAWHQAHGPKRTVVGRCVRVYKYGKGLINTIDLPKWKPGFMVDIVAQTLGLKQAKVENSLRKLQTSQWVDVRRSVKRDGVQLYNLTMGKYVVGIIAYDEQRNIHYHGNTRETAINNLKMKIEKMDAERKRAEIEGSEILTAEKAHTRFGFCYPGMTEFAKAIGFDIDGQYSINELRKAVSELKDRRIIAKYRGELKTAKII